MSNHPATHDPSSAAYDRLIQTLTPTSAQRTVQYGWDYFKAGVLIPDEWPDPVPDHDPETTYLLVREAKVKQPQPDGTTQWVLSDEGKWNLPCGRLHLGETFEQAALREGREETGFELCPERSGVPVTDSSAHARLVHIGHRLDLDNPYVILIYVAVEHRFIAPPDADEIAELGRFTYDEIVSLCDAGQLRNPDLVMGALDAYLDRGDFLVTYPPKLLPP